MDDAPQVENFFITDKVYFDSLRKSKMILLLYPSHKNS